MINPWKEAHLICAAGYGISPYVLRHIQVDVHMTAAVVFHRAGMKEAALATLDLAEELNRSLIERENTVEAAEYEVNKQAYLAKVAETTTDPRLVAVIHGTMTADEAIEAMEAGEAHYDETSN